jgi:hypothetical protein
VKRLRKRDWRFLVLVLVHVIGIAGFWSGGVGRTAGEAGGWRSIDVDAVKDKIDSGDLVDREADWYRVLPATMELRR